MNQAFLKCGCSIRRWVVLAVCLVGMAGCESDSARSPVVIDPGHIRMRRGQEQEFVASGGYEYEWSVENKTMGTLSRTPQPNRVIYTATQAPEGETPAQQVLWVTSWVQGASQGGSGATNVTGGAQTASYQVRTEAYIVHLPDPDPPPPSESTALAISPADVVMSATDTARSFTVSGGRPGYTWSLSNGALGTLIASGRTAVFTRGPNPGSLFIIVTDSSGRRVEASVILNGTQAAGNGGNDAIPNPD